VTAQILVHELTMCADVCPGGRYVAVHTNPWKSTTAVDAHLARAYHSEALRDRPDLIDARPRLGAEGFSKRFSTQLRVQSSPAPGPEFS
jgi:hypothetical protein